MVPTTMRTLPDKSRVESPPVRGQHQTGYAMQKAAPTFPARIASASAARRRTFAYPGRLVASIGGFHSPPTPTTLNPRVGRSIGISMRFFPTIFRMKISDPAAGEAQFPDSLDGIRGQPGLQRRSIRPSTPAVPPPWRRTPGARQDTPVFPESRVPRPEGFPQAHGIPGSTGTRRSPMTFEGRLASRENGRGREISAQGQASRPRSPIHPPGTHRQEARDPGLRRKETGRKPERRRRRREAASRIPYPGHPRGRLFRVPRAEGRAAIPTRRHPAPWRTGPPAQGVRDREKRRPRAKGCSSKVRRISSYEKNVTSQGFFTKQTTDVRGSARPALFPPFALFGKMPPRRSGDFRPTASWFT